MKVFRRLCRAALTALLVSAVTFCHSVSAAGNTVPSMPLQEEMQYLSTSRLAEEENLLAILWVQRSAEFRGLSYQAYNLAAMEVDKALAQRRKKENSPAQPNHLRPLAVVLDIDDTIICNAPFEAYFIEHPERKVNFDVWNQWIAKHNELLPGAVDFLKFADERGLQIFYVTGRGPQDKDVTARFLQKAGLPFTDETHLLMNDRSGNKMKQFAKLARRYDIICYLGDNVGDFPIEAVRDENEIKYLKTTDNKIKNDSAGSHSSLKNTEQDDVKTNRPMPLDVSAMLKHDKNKKRNAIIDANKKLFGTKFILLPNPMYGDWERNLAKKYRKLPAEQRIALRKAALKSFEFKEETK